MFISLIDNLRLATGEYTWLADHQERPSAPTNSLHKIHMARYQVLLTYLLMVHDDGDPQNRVFSTQKIERLGFFLTKKAQ